MDDSPLLLALREHSRLHIIGAARVTVLAGEARVLGAILRQGDSQDIVSLPYDSALYLEAVNVQDARLHASGENPHGAHILAAILSQQTGTRLAESGSGSRAKSTVELPDAGSLQRCVIEVRPVHLLSSLLSEYDVEGAGVCLTAYSRAVRGAVLTPHDPASGPGGSMHPADYGAVVAVRAGAAQLTPLGSDPTYPIPGSHGSQRCRLVARALDEAPSWASMSSAMASCRNAGKAVSPCVFVMGSKGAGKSTFVRYLTNSLLSSSLLIESAGLHFDDADFGGAGAQRSRGGKEEDRGKAQPAVAFLDLDLGQPEHTPSGFLSLSIVTRPLLLPPHLRVHACMPAVVGSERVEVATVQAGMPWVKGTPCADDLLENAAALPPGSGVGRADATPTAIVSMRFIGSTSVKDDVDGFVHAACELVDIYRAQLAPAGMPLVVNTHGWVKGLGALSLGRVLSYSCPTHCVHLDAGKRQGGAGGQLSAVADEDDDGDGEDYDDSYHPPFLPAADAVADLFPGHTTSVPSPSAASGSAANGSGTVRHDEDALALHPPELAWQYCAPGAQKIGVPLRPVIYRIRAWHSDFKGWVTGGQLGLQAPSGAPSSAMTGGPMRSRLAGSNAPPPRAARSPADARAARLLVYLLSNLRYPDGVSCAADHDAELAERSAVRRFFGGRGSAADGRERCDEDGMSSAGEDALPSPSPGSHGDGDGDGGLRVGREEEEEDDAEQGEDEDEDMERGDGNEGEGEPYDGIPVCNLTLVQAGALFWHRAARAASDMFRALLNDHRRARTPTAGLGSPAWHARSSLPLRVPAASLRILLTPSEDVHSSECAGGGEGERRARALVGTLVALASRSRAQSPAPVTSLHPAPCLGTSLPCVGLAYVRGYDPIGVGSGSGTTGAGTLHLLSPVPARLLVFVDTLLGWPGSGLEVPPQLLYRAAPEGDPFCYATDVLVGVKDGAGAVGREGQARKNLKRKRLGPR